MRVSAAAGVPIFPITARARAFFVLCFLLHAPGAVYLYAAAPAAAAVFPSHPPYRRARTYSEDSSSALGVLFLSHEDCVVTFGV